MLRIGERLLGQGELWPCLWEPLKLWLPTLTSSQKGEEGVLFYFRAWPWCQSVGLVVVWQVLYITNFGTRIGKYEWYVGAVRLFASMLSSYECLFQDCSLFLYIANFTFLCLWVVLVWPWTLFANVNGCLFDAMLGLVLCLLLYI